MRADVGSLDLDGSGSSSIRCRRNVNLLERNVRLRIPSLQVSFASPKVDTRPDGTIGFHFEMV
jgi:hypothetical protein